MNPESFRLWLLDMRYAGLAKSDADCARLLDRNLNVTVIYKKTGTDKVTALACAALLKNMRPYGENHTDRLDAI